MSNSKQIILKIAENGIVAAIYFVLTAFVPAFSFGPIQLRIGEMLVLLAFWRPDFISGLTIGCVLANVYGAALGLTTPWDILIGSGATLLAATGCAFFSPRLFVAVLYPILFNGVIVGAELYLLYDQTIPMVLQMLYVAAGEAIAMVAGYVLWILLIRNKGVRKAIQPMRHADIFF